LEVLMSHATSVAALDNELQVLAAGFVVGRLFQSSSEGDAVT
jgi:hypothetical protein